MNYDSLPEGFSLFRAIDLNTKKLKVWLNVASLAILAALAVPVIIVVPRSTQAMGLLYALAAIVFGIGYMLLHEWIHGLGFRLAAVSRSTATNCRFISTPPVKTAISASAATTW